MLLNKTIRLFLDSIGRREEYEFYLNKFQAAGADCFALLVPDLESLEQGAEALAFDLKFLLKLGLRPAVILCGDDAAAKWNLLKDNNLFELTEFPGIGKRKAGIPVFVEENISALDSLLQKVPAIGKRVHFIRAGGGLSTEYYYVQKPGGELAPEDKAMTDTAAALLEARPGTHISVTSPINLLKEIFTVKVPAPCSGAAPLFFPAKLILPGCWHCLKKASAGSRKRAFWLRPRRFISKKTTVVRRCSKNSQKDFICPNSPLGLKRSRSSIFEERCLR